MNIKYIVCVCVCACVHYSRHFLSEIFWTSTDALNTDRYDKVLGFKVFLKDKENKKNVA